MFGDETESFNIIMSNIIFLFGYNKSGKDTIGQHLVTHHNYKRISFADQVKIEVAEQYGVNLNDLHIQGPIKEQYRPILIEHAEKKKETSPYYWVNKAFEPYSDMKLLCNNHLVNFLSKESESKLVVTDMCRMIEVDYFMHYYENLDLGLIKPSVFKILRDVPWQDPLTTQAMVYFDIKVLQGDKFNVLKTGHYQLINNNGELDETLNYIDSLLSI